MIDKNLLGWKLIHNFINMKKSLYVKKTNNPFYNNDFKFDFIIRTESFFSENNKIYTWTKRSTLFQNSDFYVYGNPWPRYQLDL